jgi:hypothetical protein
MVCTGTRYTNTHGVSGNACVHDSESKEDEDGRDVATNVTGSTAV